jgi:drug/metabolite transporter (DMT)-like permease
MRNRVPYVVQIGLVMVVGALLTLAFRGIDAQRPPDERGSTFVVFGLPLLIGLFGQFAVAIKRPSAEDAGTVAFVIAIVAALVAWFVALVIGLNIWGS